jgi:hypothetical protein
MPSAVAPQTPGYPSTYPSTAQGLWYIAKGSRTISSAIPSSTRRQPINCNHEQQPVLPGLLAFVFITGACTGHMGEQGRRRKVRAVAHPAVFHSPAPVSRARNVEAWPVVDFDVVSLPAQQFASVYDEACLLNTLRRMQCSFNPGCASYRSLAKHECPWQRGKPALLCLGETPPGCNKTKNSVSQANEQNTLQKYPLPWSKYHLSRPLTMANNRRLDKKTTHARIGKHSLMALQAGSYTYYWNKSPMHGCQTGTKCPLLHVR